MQTAIRLYTKVLPGRRIEVSAPELPEGADVELIVMLNESEQTARPRKYIPMLELVEALPPGPHLFNTWQEYERFLQEEKNSWDR